MKSLLVVFLTMAFYFANAQDLRVSLDGMVVFNEENITISDAGSDFAVTVESESPLYVAIIFGNFWDKSSNPNAPWRIEVQKSDYNWNNNLVLETVRAGDGINTKNRNKPTKIYHGTNYQAVNNMSGYFFRGRGEIGDIPVNFRITGMSVVNGAQDFETKVVFTIYDD
jgi:hypothetical protein